MLPSLAARNGSLGEVARGNRGRNGRVPTAMPDTGPNFLFVTRIGFAARGLLYLLVGYLALRLGRAEDAAGALDYLQSRTGGMVLGGLAVGFAFYGAWRLLDAVLDTQAKGSELKGVIGRV